MAKKVGLDSSEMEEMSIGFVMDVIIEYTNMLTPKDTKNGNKTNKVRQATEADIRALKRM